MPKKAKTVYATASNDAIARLIGRPAVQRFGVAICGSFVVLTRHQGGCWKVDGVPKAVDALKAKIRTFANTAAHAKAHRGVCKVVSRPAVLPVVVDEGTVEGRDFYVTEHNHRGRLTYLATAPATGRHRAIMCTGGDPADVRACLEDSIESLPRVVREETFRGRQFKVTVYTTPSGPRFVGRSGRYTRTGTCPHDVYTRLLDDACPPVCQGQYAQQDTDAAFIGDLAEYTTASSLTHNPFEGAL